MHSIHKIPWEMKDGSDLKTHSHFDLDRSKPNRLESVLGNIVWINLFGSRTDFSLRCSVCKLNVHRVSIIIDCCYCSVSRCSFHLVAPHGCFKNI